MTLGPIVDVLAGEVDTHPIDTELLGDLRGQRISEVEIDSGWKEQRKINTDLIRKKYDEIGLEYPEVVDKFLKEYGMLNINPRDKCYFDVSFNAIKAIGCNLDGSYFKECLAEYDINETVYPIGEACRKNLLVLMTLTESFYCFTDGLLLFLGGSVDEMLDCIVGECRNPIEIE